jgi:hypothetical protein
VRTSVFEVRGSSATTWEARETARRPQMGRDNDLMGRVIAEGHVARTSALRPKGFGRRAVFEVRGSEARQSSPGSPCPRLISFIEFVVRDSLTHEIVTG